eukprot:2320511-Rhodomonas_salina.1
MMLATRAVSGQLSRRKARLIVVEQLSWRKVRVVEQVSGRKARLMPLEQLSRRKARAVEQAVEQ